MRLKDISSFIASCYYCIREKISPSSIQCWKDIPIIINNFNRLESLKMLIAVLKDKGYDNIYVLDNASTYPPLLEYYKIAPVEVLFLGENLGFKALWKSKYKRRFCGDYYIYTDSDVVPIQECPDDFVDHFLNLLKSHPLARKVGFSLRIDNLPDHYAHKSEVIKKESEYYAHPAGDGLFKAPIDTTFALYRPRVGLSRSRSVEAYRTAYPYVAEHLPWYSDSNNISEEEQYYIDHCTQVTEWSSRSKSKE